MGVTAEGWLDWAVRDIPPHNSDLGPKIYSAINARQGFIPHSQEGYANSRNSRLFDTSIYFDDRRGIWRYTANAEASWTLYFPKHGPPIQHYAFTASCWTSGSRYPNTHFNTGEFEGMAGEPLTEDQHQALVRVIRELSAEYGWTPKRPVSPEDVTASLYEHRECVRWGSAATACPSDRIDWPRVLREVAMPDKDDVIERLRGEQLVIFGILQALSVRDWRRVRDIAQAVLDAGN